MSVQPNKPVIIAGEIASVFAEIRLLNREGVEWTKGEAETLALKHSMDAEKIFGWGIKIYEKFLDEKGAFTGTYIKRLEAHLNDTFLFRRNPLSRSVSYKLVSEPKGEWMNCNYNDIWRFIQHNKRDMGIREKVGISDVQTILESDFVKEYNPIKDYFDNIEPWDGEEYIDAFANHIQCEDQEFWLTQFRKCLVRMIACSYSHIENRIVMTLYTKNQAIGKNRFIKFLVPDKLKEYFKEDPITDHKDSEIALTQNFLWHMDELESLNRKDLTALKSFISRSTSKQRLAYARQELPRPRIVNFWASTNKDEFLQDVQNTRWLCFRIKSINWDYDNEFTGVKKVNIDKVWSQAWHLYQSGFNFRLDENERTAQEKVNKSFETISIEKQLIAKHLHSCLPNAMNGEFMLPVDILEYITKSSGRMNLSQYAITPALIQLGFEQMEQKINGKMLKGFWCLKVHQEGQTNFTDTDKEDKIDHSQITVPF